MHKAVLLEERALDWQQDLHLARGHASQRRTEGPHERLPREARANAGFVHPRATGACASFHARHPPAIDLDKARRDGSRVRARATDPVLVQDLSVRQAGRLLLERATISVRPDIEYTPARVSAALTDLKINLPAGDSITGSLTSQVTGLPQAPVVDFTTDLAGRLGEGFRQQVPEMPTAVRFTATAQGHLAGDELQVARYSITADLVPDEFRAEGVADALIWSSAAAASLTSGIVVAWAGFATLGLLALALIAVPTVLLLGRRRAGVTAHGGVRP